MKELKVKIRHRTNEAETWRTINPILEPGEVGIESDTGKFKYGDGKRPWQQLEYAFGTGLSCQFFDSVDALPLASDFPGSIAIVPRSYTTESEGTFVLDTPYISLRKNGKWNWFVFSDQLHKPIISNLLDSFILDSSLLG